MKLPRLSLAYFCRNGLVFHIAKARMRGPTPCQVHTHDFAEVFWIEEGSGIHAVNGTRQPLSRGTLVMMRPNDCHGFRNQPGTAGFTLVNIAFSVATLEFLRNRYFAGLNSFFWSTDALPYSLPLTPAQQSWLHGWADYLGRQPSTQLNIERFLMELLAELRVQTSPVESAPAWLQRALEAVREPRHFNGGAPAFARLAGRSSQHVNRALKQHCGLTATEIVNRARMEHAATELIISTKKIIEICLECGFQNLGHFYQVFQKYHGTTPRSYRLRHRAVLP